MCDISLRPRSASIRPAKVGSIITSRPNEAPGKAYPISNRIRDYYLTYICNLIIFSTLNRAPDMLPSSINSGPHSRSHFQPSSTLSYRIDKKWSINWRASNAWMYARQIRTVRLSVGLVILGCWLAMSVNVVLFLVKACKEPDQNIASWLLSRHRLAWYKF